jgi:dUTP pyrophosphatase
MQVQVIINDKRITEEMLKPGTSASAGIDLRAAIDDVLVIKPGEVVLVSSGISIFLEEASVAGMILPRSGLGHKGLVLGNLVGLIDSDYQGELKISLWNRSQESFMIDPLDRIAQLVIVPIVRTTFLHVESFSLESDRGKGGFGSTGINGAGSYGTL